MNNEIMGTSKKHAENAINETKAKKEIFGLIPDDPRELDRGMLRAKLLEIILPASVSNPKSYREAVIAAVEKHLPKGVRLKMSDTTLKNLGVLKLKLKPAPSKPSQESTVPGLNI